MIPTPFLRRVPQPPSPPAAEHRLDKPTCRKVSQVLSMVGDKWTVLVVTQLGEGSRRFSELKREVEGVSQRMLTLTLKNLERDGLVTRTVTPSIPPRVDYALTDLGCSLLRPVRGLGVWAQAHMGEMDAARARYDGRLS